MKADGLSDDHCNECDEGFTGQMLIILKPTGPSSGEGFIQIQFLADITAFIDTQRHFRRHMIVRYDGKIARQ